MQDCHGGQHLARRRERRRDALLARVCLAGAQGVRNVWGVREEKGERCKARKKGKATKQGRERGAKREECEGSKEAASWARCAKGGKRAKQGKRQGKGYEAGSVKMQSVRIRVESENLDVQGVRRCGTECEARASRAQGGVRHAWGDVRIRCEDLDVSGPAKNSAAPTCSGGAEKKERGHNPRGVAKKILGPWSKVRGVKKHGGGVREARRPPRGRARCETSVGACKGRAASTPRENARGKREKRLN